MTNSREALLMDFPWLLLKASSMIAMFSTEQPLLGFLVCGLSATEPVSINLL